MIQHCEKDTDERKATYWQKNLFQCHFVHHNSHMVFIGIEPGSPPWDAGEWPLSRANLKDFRILECDTVAWQNFADVSGEYDTSNIWPGYWVNSILRNVGKFLPNYAPSCSCGWYLSLVWQPRACVAICCSIAELNTGVRCGFLLTKSERDLSQRIKIFTATKQITHILWNPKFHCRLHKSPPYLHVSLFWARLVHIPYTVPAYPLQ